MVGKSFKGAFCLLVLTLATSAVFAQSTPPAIAHTTLSKDVTPAVTHPAGLKVIFSNLGPTSTNDYNASGGYYVLGPSNSLTLSEQYVAVPFTPKANSTVTAMQVAVGWISGTKAVIVGIYSDNAGTVGTLLASGETQAIPAFGACCQLVGVKVASTAVTAGTQYWIGVSTDDARAGDFTGVFESSNEANTAANEAQTGWFTFSNNWPAAAAYGTTP